MMARATIVLALLPAMATALARLPVAQRSPVVAIRAHPQPRMSLMSAANVWCPLAGVFTSNALYCSPLAAVLERDKAGSMGDLNPLPAAVTVLSSAAWLQYGLSVANPYIVASNVPGVVASIAGFVIMLPLMMGSSKLKLVQGTFVAGCAATLGLWTWLIFSGMEAAARSTTLGLWASALFIVLCSSPLSSMRQIITSRDASSVYAPMTAAQCLNCGLWTFYGVFAIGDVFVWGPNLVGLLLGITQIGLKLYFPSKKEE